VKYRIVCRNRTPITREVQDCYYIQTKLLNVLWIDCSVLNYFSTEKWSRTWDFDFDGAEYFLKEMMSKKEPKEPIKQTVIKTYDD
jgi:hypothetical protein